MNNGKDRNFRTMRGYQLANQPENGLTSAMEDYLEMIGRLCRQEGYTRVGRLSEKIQVKPSSASKMVGKLMELGYLAYDSNDSILLTETGGQIAGCLLLRHDTIERFLLFLGNPDPLQETELLEHYVSPRTVTNLSELLLFFEQDKEARAKYKEFISRQKSELP